MVTIDGNPVSIKALHDHVIVTDMHFGETTTSAGIVLRDDDGQAHGVKPRWARVYTVGPEQHDVNPGEWILIEHGRWSRKIHVLTAEGEQYIQRVDPTGIIGVSNVPPTADDVTVADSL